MWALFSSKKDQRRNCTEGEKLTCNNTKGEEPSLQNHQLKNSALKASSSSSTTTRRRTKVSLNCVERLKELGFEFRYVSCGSGNRKSTNLTKATSSSVVVDDAKEKENSLNDRKETRLFHVESNIMITPKNRSYYIPDGIFFDQVAKIAQQVVIQEYLIPKYGLKMINLYNDNYNNDESLKNHSNNEDCNMISALWDDSKNFDREDSIEVGISPNKDDDDDENAIESTFVFITGKGLSRAGIISAREVLERGLERGSVLYFIQKARKRRWKAIFIDPNAKGVRYGMETIQKSIDVLSLRGYLSKSLYILAHSAAGGYIVRYLVDRASASNDSFLSTINALVFTDSTHRIAWTRNNPDICRFLQSSRCLYIRNNSLGDPFATDNKNHNHLPGELVARTDIWWKQRFGEIRTVWGGTIDHSAICWTARHIIWDFFIEKT